MRLPLPALLTPSNVLLPRGNRRMPFNTALRRCTPLLLLSLVACGNGDTPQQVAERYMQAYATGDVVLVHPMLSRADSAAAAGFGQMTNPPIIVPREGEPAMTVDSTRLIEERGDSATVRTFVTVPNWAAAQAPPATDTSVIRTTVRDPALAASLPRVHDYQDVTVVREDGSWKLALGLSERAEMIRLSDLVGDGSIPLKNRVPHARKLLADSARLHIHDFTAAKARAVIEGARIMDSVRIELAPLYGTTSLISIEVINPTTTPIRTLRLSIKDADGRVSEASVYGVPADGRDTGLTRGPVRLPARDVRIVEIETGEMY